MKAAFPRSRLFGGHGRPGGGLRDGHSLALPGLNALKADIERGRITRVWVADLTRLSSDPAGLESIRMYLALHKVELAVRR